jgi:hypothetical protein
MRPVKRLINFLAMLVASMHVTGSTLPKKNNTFHTADAPMNKVQHGRYSFTGSGDANSYTDSSEIMIDVKYKAAIDRLKQQAAAIKSYAQANNYNTEYCFLVDMSLPSGKNRFFVYNIKKDVLEMASLVSHGFGSTVKGSEDELIFSNNHYSFKTSLGKYKIGSSYNGTYGLAYKLYGLDSTNNKAFQRAIVLHSDVHIPESEAYPYKIFQSAGCPTVSPGFLPVLSNYIKASKKPILMWIYK